MLTPSSPPPDLLTALRVAWQISAISSPRALLRLRVRFTCPHNVATLISAVKMTVLVLMVPFSQPIRRLSFMADSLNHLCWIGRAGRGVLNGGMLLLGHSSSSFNHSSINVYLSAVQSLHINNGLPDPLTNKQYYCLQLQRLLRGVRHVQGPLPLSAFPSLSISCTLLSALLKPYSSDHVMLWAASWLGFFGFLSAGKFTTNTPFVQSIHLGVSDVQADSLGDPTCFTKLTSSVQRWIPLVLAVTSTGVHRTGQ